MIGADVDRPPVFSALIVVGAVATAVVAVAGRNPATETMVAVYLALLPLAVLRQALAGSDGGEPKT